jgi:hypothetical protein
VAGIVTAEGGSGGRIPGVNMTVQAFAPSTQKAPKSARSTGFLESHAANPVQGARVGWMLHQADGDLLLARILYTF